jgi:hypothetical protein
MDRYKWYASRSSRMSDLVFSDGLFSLRRSFVKETFATFNNKKGINSILLVYFDEDTRSNPNMNFFRIYFSVDGKMIEIKDLNPSIDGDPFYMISVDTGKRIEDNYHMAAMDFILHNIVELDRMNIRNQTRQGKNVAIVQIDYDEHLIPTDTIAMLLRDVFNRCFVKELGEMNL